MTQAPSADAKPGLRERNKAQKARLIREAARHLFFTKGYEATTLREVAALADVGFGTVSAYAVDKAGLLAMLYVDDLDHLPPLFNDVDTSATLLDQLLAGFGKLYEFWAKSPELSRVVLPQMEFYIANPFIDVIMKRREQLQVTLAEWLTEWQRQGRIGQEHDPAQVAATLFAIYTSALRGWITQDPLDLDEGRKRLAYLLSFPVQVLARDAS
ncbi:MAG: helix-turn-helix domain-containing protein [Pseudomonadota bacterium]